MFASTMARFNGVTALGLSVGLAGLSVSATALAEPPAVVSSSPYQPAPPDSPVYRPGPQTSYSITYGSAGPSTSAPTLMARGPQVHPTVSTGDRFSREDVLGATWLGFSLIVLLTGAGLLYVIHKHKDENDGQGRV